jgi:hypothetical protein
MGACRAGTTSSPRFESPLAGHAREWRDGPHEFARVFRGLWRIQIDFTSTYADFTTLEPGFVLQERIAGPEVRNRDSQMRAHLGLSQVVHRPASSATLRR